METEQQYTHIRHKHLLEQLCAPAKFISHRRSQRRLHPREALVRIQGVQDSAQASKYVGNEVEMFRIYTDRTGTERAKSVQGYVVKVHGGRGVVVCRFVRNLSPTEINTRVYVKLCKAEAYYCEE